MISLCLFEDASFCFFFVYVCVFDCLFVFWFVGWFDWLVGGLFVYSFCLLFFVVFSSICFLFCWITILLWYGKHRKRQFTLERVEVLCYLPFLLKDRIVSIRAIKKKCPYPKQSWSKSMHRKKRWSFSSADHLTLSYMYNSDTSFCFTKLLSEITLNRQRLDLQIVVIYLDKIIVFGDMKTSRPSRKILISLLYTLTRIA